MAKIVLLFLLSAVCLFSWWFEMFSDLGYGQMMRALNKKRGYGKNISALTTPAGAIVFLFAALALTIRSFGAEEGAVRYLVYGLSVFVLLAFLGLFPIPLPGWMYPEYHVARRERVRAEKLARGEVVRMPSSGSAAVEAQRIEQALRAQERPPTPTRRTCR